MPLFDSDRVLQKNKKKTFSQQESSSMQVAGDAGWTVRRHVLFIMHASRSTSDKKKGEKKKDMGMWNDGPGSFSQVMGVKGG